MNVRACLALIVLLLFTSSAGAVDTEKERTLLVHVTSPLADDTDRTVLVFRVIASAMRKGNQVILLFDADSAASLRMGRWFGGHSTPIDRVRITEEERGHLASLLGTAPDAIPDIYGSLLHFLKGRGLRAYVNKRALELRGIGEDIYDHAAEAVTEDVIIELLNGATAYVAY